ncbi:ABC transporter I family member 20 [Acorus calamus]|uniref:ABC transporter I family member 20 n=1 Tax=Acorus calamus TaxID=4465 RepID=A0AAV9EY50_ACOCL|nr:ABC transporter I family member 20 [Acorus calamus]
MGDTVNKRTTIEINGLKFTYPGIDGHPPPGSKPLIDDFSLSLGAGDRCLLVGSNGAGKTTILKILGGKHMVDPGMVRVLGRSAFHDTGLTSSGDLCYLGGEVLDIDLSWRMHKSSDGQRRRVQICMGLLKPFKVLLLDEITVDLDVLARANLLSFLKKDCEERGATIIYATHIFDGLENWPTHIVYVAHGRLQLALPMAKVRETSDLSLMRTVERWLRKERGEDRKRRKERKAKGISEAEEGRTAVKVMNNGWAAGRLHSTMAGAEEIFFFSSNRVLRQ